MKRFSWIAIAALCVATACGSDEGKDPKPTDTSGEPTPADQGSGGQPPPSSPPPTTPTPTSPPPTSPPPTSPPPTNPPPTTPPPSNPPPSAKYVVNVSCSPVNDFGYIGWAQGTLEIGERNAEGAFVVRGSLAVRYKFIDDPETAKQVEVEGTLDRDGAWIGAKVTSGADDLEGVFFALSSGVDSHLDGPNGSPQYQTRCDASTAVVPHGSDLRLDGAVRFSPEGAGTIGAEIAVVNVGNEPTSGASGRATVGGTTGSATLYADGGSSPNTLNPGERGVVKVVLPEGSLARCMVAEVAIDVDHTFQSGDPDPFGNDAGKVATPCLTWSTPISAESMGVAPDPFLEGKTLGGIVGSAEVGRKDGNLCSACHHGTSGNEYAPSVPAGGSAAIAPADTIGDTSWAAPGGWAARFLTNPIGKPEYLKAVVQRWLDDGARP